MKLEGRRVLVTGGGSGIGYALAREFARANTVAIVGRDRQKLGTAVASTPSLIPFQLDVTDAEGAPAVIEQAAAEMGGLDILVNNAGLLRSYPVDARDAEEKAVADVNVNLLGPMRMTRLALPLLRRSSDAAVVFVSSAVALAALPRFAVYTATKAGLHAYARSLRLELAASGIRVFEILPPVVDTGPMAGLEVPKLSPTAVAAAAVDALRGDREEIRIGAVRQLAPIARLMPRTGERLLAKAMGQQTVPGADGAEVGRL